MLDWAFPSRNVSKQPPPAPFFPPLLARKRKEETDWRIPGIPEKESKGTMVKTNTEMMYLYLYIIYRIIYRSIAHNYLQAYSLSHNSHSRVGTVPRLFGPNPFDMINIRPVAFLHNLMPSFPNRIKVVRDRVCQDLLERA